ncbi:MAG TPA: hypothetical protein VGF61_07730 [Candidatus Acidoferrum sp.]
MKPSRPRRVKIRGTLPFDIKLDDYYWKPTTPLTIYQQLFSP